MIGARHRSLLALAGIVVTAVPAFAQGRTIEGTVRDETGRAIPAAEVLAGPARTRTVGHPRPPHRRFSSDSPPLMCSAAPQARRAWCGTL